MTQSKIAEKNNIKVVETDSEDERKNSKAAKRRSSVFDMMPDFKNKVIIVQTTMKQIKMNVEQIEILKEDSNKIITPNKERGLNIVIV